MDPLYFSNLIESLPEGLQTSSIRPTWQTTDEEIIHNKTHECFFAGTLYMYTPRTHTHADMQASTQEYTQEANANEHPVRENDLLQISKVPGL